MKRSNSPNIRYRSSFLLAVRSAHSSRIICTGLTFAQAAALAAEIPASIVKFDRVEVTNGI